MSDEKPKRAKKGKRMVETNVRVTKETHLRIKTLAEMWGITMSEAMDLLITEHVPEVEAEIRLREEIQQKLSKRKPPQN